MTLPAAALADARTLSQAVWYHWRSGAHSHASYTAVTFAASLAGLSHAPHCAQDLLATALAHRDVMASQQVALKRASFRAFLTTDIKRRGGSIAHQLVKDRVVREPIMDVTATLATHAADWSAIWSSGSSLADSPAVGLLAAQGSPHLPSVCQSLARISPPSCCASPCDACLTTTDLHDGLSLDRLRLVIKSYPVKKQLGSDLWSTADLRHLPLHVLRLFLVCLRICQRARQWPAFFQLNFMAMLPKPLGGFSVHC